jgi:hypothetical protein
VTERTCAVPGCTQPHKRGDYCYGHYMKNWRYGTPTPTHSRKWQDLQGQRFGQLVAVERTGRAWLCRCDCGRTAIALAGDLNRGSAITCGDRATHRRTDGADYTAAHQRVRTDRGNARDHECVDCGKGAAHWSYDHADPDERHSTQWRTEGIAFSLDPAHYEPRCVPCHKRFDLGRIDAVRV